SANAFANTNDCGRAADVWHWPKFRSGRFATDIRRSRKADAGNDDSRRTTAGGRHLAHFARAVSRTTHRSTQSCDQRHRSTRNAVESNASGNTDSAGARSVCKIESDERFAAIK